VRVYCGARRGRALRPASVAPLRARDARPLRGAALIAARGSITRTKAAIPTTREKKGMRSKLKLLAAAVSLGAAASGPAWGQACDRACLEGFVDRYLDAMIDDDPSAVPFAPGARFTEHGQRLEIGDGLWNTMKSKGNYRLFVSDVEAGQVAVIGTINEDHRDPEQESPALIALRLKIRDGRIVEAEQQVVRNEEAARRVEARGAPHPIWLETVPEAERMSRRELIETANKYFTGMQLNDGKGDYPFSDDCHRLENGMDATNVPTPPGETRPDPKTAT